MKNMPGLMTIVCMIYMLFPPCNVSGQNPIITNIFTSDPAALVYGDSVYLFTGHDEASVSDDGFRIYNWHVFSSADMVNWKDHGPILTLNHFTWSVANAWAGHCIEKEGKFYWYVPMSHNGTKPGFAIGVAVADHPLGPYMDALGKALITNDMTTNLTIDWDDIDPAAFIDDDGQAYLFWGNTSCKYVKLKNNMIELDGEIQYINLPNFTEGPWVHKHNDLYYLTYAAIYPEEIHYAISNSITGPWEYKGRINQTIINSPTNHPAIIEFKNQWYFIYHTAALPTGGEFRRSVAIDYLFYNPDSSIMEIVQTSEGVANADSTAVCPPVSVIPRVKVNDGDWTDDRILSLAENDDAILSPLADDTGEWIWEGPGAFTDSLSEISLNNLKYQQSGIYYTTFTNNCGTKSYMNFSLDILPSLPDDIVSLRTYVIKPRNSEMAVAVQNALASDGANVIQTAFSNKENQVWRLIRVSSVYWKLVPMHDPTRVMGVTNSSLNDGANVNTWSYANGLNQQWIIVKQDSGIYQLIARHSGKCLDVDGTTTTEGANVRQWTCNNSERQQFVLIDAADLSSVAPQVNTENLVRIFPNPAATGNITIDLSRTKKPLEIFISDVNGKILYRDNMIKSRIVKPEVKFLPGIYMVSVICDNAIYNLKFVSEY